MSGPGAGWGGQPGTTAAPGWYPDPDGAPGLLRWFDGATWSDVTTPAGPGVALAGGGDRWTPPPHAGWYPAAAPVRSPYRPLMIALGALGLVVVVVLAVVLGRSGGSGTTDRPAGGSAAQQSPAPGSAFPPGTVRIVDEDAGISYPFLGNGWYEYNLSPQRETTAVAGQFFTTQEVTPQGTTFIAQCTSGPLADGYGWTGPGSLETALDIIADSVRVNYYPQPNERRVRTDEARTVDGAAARLYEFDLSWDVAGYDATGERAALLLVDVGRATPALLYISIPNTHAELYGVIDQVVDAVAVL